MGTPSVSDVSWSEGVRNLDCSVSTEIANGFRFLTLTSAHDAWNKLSEIAELVTPQATSREEFIKECQDGRLDGVVAAYRTFGSVSITGLFDDELVNVLPKSWRFLCHCGAGYDQMPGIEAATNREPSLLISNIHSATEAATADTAMFLLLGALRNFNTMMVELRRGQWKGTPLPAKGHDPEGKVLGILGMGGIGRNIAQKARAFGMSIIYHNRRKLDDKLSAGAEYVSFDELLKRSDVLTLHVPLSAGTRRIIGAEQFRQMKSTAILINTARGPVVDEAALVAALDSGIIAGAGLDVYDDEPNIHPGLIKNERVILLPHVGTWTSETEEKMELSVIDNIRNAVTKGRLLTPIPEQAS